MWTLDGDGEMDDAEEMKSIENGASSTPRATVFFIFSRLNGKLDNFRVADSSSFT